MQAEAIQYIYSLMSRLGKLSRRQVSGETEPGDDMAMLSLLFNPANEGGCIRMTDISRHLMISKPAATQVINRLAERQLVERVRDAADRRVVYIRATEEGTRMFAEKLNARLAVLKCAVDRIGMEKANQLGALLDEFVDVLVSISED